QGEVDGRERVEQFGAVVVEADGEGAAHIAGPAGEVDVGTGRRAPLPGDLEAVDHFARAHEHRTGDPVEGRGDVDTQVDAVGAVDVEPSGGAEDRRVAGGGAGPGVRGRIGRRTRGVAAVGVDVHDAQGHRARR